MPRATELPKACLLRRLLGELVVDKSFDWRGGEPWLRGGDLRPTAPIGDTPDWRLVIVAIPVVLGVALIS